MTDLKITEAGTVQFPMVRHAAEIGWTAISPSDARQKRGDEAEMLFRDERSRAVDRILSILLDTDTDA